MPCLAASLDSVYHGEKPEVQLVAWFFLRGWDFTPIVADTYGAFRANGRAVIQKIIQRLQRKNRYQDRGKIATQVWRAVAAAAVSRAANQTLHTAEALQLGQTGTK